MGLKVRLAWYNKSTELGEGKELSQDFGDDVAVLIHLKLSTEHDINNGEFNVKNDWLTILQPLFMHRINLDAFDYQVSFNYKK
ncbi:colicin E3-like toxin immunity protein [Pseudomonas sp. CCC3.1]|uniref:colicin E3-like toxin immunity protein n=1 Tax=Pseudomonas sp. CCC3.1 TaxID=3048607 RepID=UPI002AC9ADCE|nr:colicin E3-like toxin immunity protein [Pseudomonas sp. CCC3.1]MEB0203975.1 colicin E3-like toxin immunity protein [Pseudomonas sp. CCC3.1]WPX37801.1 colicin E3-like toxin immunity protein [Pseudomonas sp. CCC3.1]